MASTTTTTTTTTAIRREVSKIMRKQPNGAFFVRDATREPSFYTLTVRMDGMNHLIRIMFRDGLYGLVEPLVFNSVVELVDYYKENSLSQQYSELNFTLGAPVCKQQVGHITASCCVSELAFACVNKQLFPVSFQYIFLFYSHPSWLTISNMLV